MTVFVKMNGKWVKATPGIKKFKYRVNFDATTFQTDPLNCLTYKEDATGMVRVKNVNATTLQRADAGSWIDGNPLIDMMFYATVNGDGTIAHVLDPEDLTKDVTGADMSTEITQKNVMLVIPTLWTKGDADGFTIANYPFTGGSADAHTFKDANGNSHTYKYLAIGVYEGKVTSNVLMSVSGVSPTWKTTRANFRTAVWKNSSSSPSTGATANGQWMLTNFYCNRLMRMIGYLLMKTFNSQANLGNGYSSGGAQTSEATAALTTGLGNTLGRFAGDTTGTGSVVKMLIENPWGSKWEFLDGAVTDVTSTTGLYDGIYLSNLLQENDTTSDKVLKGLVNPTGSVSNQYSNAIKTYDSTYGDALWGVWNNNGGNSSAGLCDAHWSNTSAQRLFLAGGSSTHGPSDGLGCLNCNNALSTSNWNIGARPAFVFD